MYQLPSVGVVSVQSTRRGWWVDLGG